MIRLLNLGFVLSLLVASLATANEPSQGIINRVSKDSSRVGINGGYASFNLSTSENNLNVLLGGISFTHGLSNYFGFIANFEQAFGTGSLIEIGGTVPFWGSLAVTNTVIEYNGRPVIENRSFQPLSVRGEVFALQYFLNTGSRVVGLAGAGGGVSVDYLFPQSWGLSAFARLCYTKNPELTAIPLKFGLNLFLQL